MCLVLEKGNVAKVTLFLVGMCALDGFLYAVGGWVGAELGDTVEKYDPVADCWRLTSRMTVGRYAMGVLAHEGKRFLQTFPRIAQLSACSVALPLSPE